MTKISIILPIYNVEKYLNRCVDSIINQTLQDIEIILATDGPESCDKICEEYASKDNRVKIVSHPGSYGKAFNKSLEIASGEYIGIVETDDWCDLTMYEKMYNKAKENNADVVKCGFYFAYDDESKNQPYLYRVYDTNFSIFNQPKFLCSQPAVWSCIYKKDFLFNNNIKMIEERMSFIDSPFHYETLYKSDKYFILNEPLYFYYQDNPNQSVNNVKVFDGLNAEVLAYKKIRENQNIYKELQEGFVYTTAKHLLWNFDNLKTDEQRNEFWIQAHKYVISLDISEINYLYFKPWVKEFLMKLRTRRNYLKVEAPKKDVQQVNEFVKPQKKIFKWFF